MIMAEQIELNQLNDYFTDLGKRSRPGVYFYRICDWNEEIEAFLRRYYEEARLSGVIIEGRLPNPDSRQLAYYEEMMGMEFQMNMGFLLDRLQKWLPRMNGRQREQVAGSIYDVLAGLQKAGKNENMLKNAYIKFMCWLYYKFERIVNRLGEEKIPKILYEGTVSIYELLLLSVISGAGADVVLLQVQGDVAYQRLDSTGAYSRLLPVENGKPFPENYSLKNMRQAMQEKANRQRLFGGEPELHACTNAWINGTVWDSLRKEPAARGSDPGFFCNCFARLSGVEDRVTYPSDLYQLQLDIRAANRRLVIVNDRLEPLTPDEISGIRRSNYQNLEQMLAELVMNITAPSDAKLQPLVKKVFADLISEEYAKDSGNLNRLTGRAVYLLCLLKRFAEPLFHGWHMPEVAAFFYLGGCRNENEALFLRFLARLPVDVVVFRPDLSRACCLEDQWLYEVKAEESLSLTVYPEEGVALQAGTAAYHAERDLDVMMYQNTGIYRNRQYAKANAVSLRTMYEEIAILWDEELKYRPNFATTDATVAMPVIFAKVSGVKDGDLPAYWNGIRTLMTPYTKKILSVPHLTSTSANPMKAHAVEFLRNGRLQKEKIRGHMAYPYGVLREDTQEYLLEKLQLLIDQRIIRGTFENGTEYTIVSTVLNLETDILRMIQKFDFTKKNPKLVYVITGETFLSLEDTITVAFLHLIGFDILFFVPTGYQCVERYFNQNIMEEHQLGEYMYDLSVPNLDGRPAAKKVSWRDKIFKRGT